jgi:hypothetical protein
LDVGEKAGRVDELGFARRGRPYEADPHRVAPGEEIGGDGPEDRVNGVVVLEGEAFSDD